MKRILSFVIPMIVIFGLYVSQANALLLDRGNNLFYDDDLDITWLVDGGLSGANTWQNQVAWADGLNYGGFDDWGLAEIGELDHLYNEENISSSSSGPFINFELFYWSGTEYTALTTSIAAYTYRFDYGYQNVLGDFNLTYGLAVRSGDVAAVPEPTTIALLGIGLVGLAGGAARRKLKKKELVKH